MYGRLLQLHHDLIQVPLAVTLLSDFALTASITQFRAFFFPLPFFWLFPLTLFSQLLIVLSISKNLLEVLTHTPFATILVILCLDQLALKFELVADSLFIPLIVILSYFIHSVNHHFSVTQVEAQHLESIVHLGSGDLLQQVYHTSSCTRPEKHRLKSLHSLHLHLIF